MQTNEYMLRACTLDFRRNWNGVIKLIKFVKSSSYHSAIGMTPFEAIYGRKANSQSSGTKLESMRIPIHD